MDNCKTCKKCAHLDMTTNFARTGSGDSPVFYCVKKMWGRKPEELRCKDFVLHAHRKDWSDN